MSLAIGELVQYFKDLADFNQISSTKMVEAIATQFKEVRHINTGVNLEVENIDEDSIRASITQGNCGITRSESKMFGMSTQVLAMQSDFDELNSFWNESMEEQKHIAEQYEMAANHLKIEGESVSEFYSGAKSGLEKQFEEMALLGASVDKIQVEIDQIEVSLIALDERQKDDAEAAGVTEGVEGEVEDDQANVKIDLVNDDKPNI